MELSSQTSHRRDRETELIKVRPNSISYDTIASCNVVISGSFPLLAASSGGCPFVFSPIVVFQFFVVLFVYPKAFLSNRRKESWGSYELAT